MHLRVICQMFLTFSITAAVADEAAFLIGEQAAAVGALPGQILGQSVVLQLGLAIVAGGVFLQHAGDGISAGEYGLAFFPGDGRAADATQLFHQ